MTTAVLDEEVTTAETVDSVLAENDAEVEAEIAQPVTLPMPPMLFSFIANYNTILPMLARSNNNGKSVKTPDITEAMKVAATYAYTIAVNEVRGGG